MTQDSALARQLGMRLAARGWRLALAESCTGGWIAKLVTDVAGSSAWFERGFVTYSNAAKIEMLGVAAETLAAHGAVSEAAAREMAAGARERSGADVALAVTGIAGPDGGTAAKPVGTVWFGRAWPDGRVEAEIRHFHGDREQVRLAAATHALRTLLQRMDHDFRDPHE